MTPETFGKTLKERRSLERIRKLLQMQREALKALKDFLKLEEADIGRAYCEAYDAGEPSMLDYSPSLQVPAWMSVRMDDAPVNPAEVLMPGGLGKSRFWAEFGALLDSTLKSDGVSISRSAPGGGALLVFPGVDRVFWCAHNLDVLGSCPEPRIVVPSGHYNVRDVTICRATTLNKEALA